MGVSSAKWNGRIGTNKNIELPIIFSIEMCRCCNSNETLLYRFEYINKWNFNFEFINSNFIDMNYFSKILHDL